MPLGRLLRLEPRLLPHHVLERFIGDEHVEQLTIERRGDTTQRRETNGALDLATLELAYLGLRDGQALCQFHRGHAEDEADRA